MSDLNRELICEGVAFNHIADTRFKLGRISATLVVPLNRRTAAANALLSFVLTRSCRLYPDFTALNRKLSSLYGAALYPSVSTLGDLQVITIAVAGLDDRYTLQGETVSAELAELLYNILFDPKLVDGHFSDEDVEQERRQLIEMIDADFNDKRTYAINRCIENMCRDEPNAIGRFGMREDVSALTHENIMSAWKQLLNDSRVELAMLGSADPTRVREDLRGHFAGKPRKVTLSTIVKNNVSEVSRDTETEEVVQSKLVMGFRCASPAVPADRIANTLMGAILGGTPTSKLFLNVREKQSLCYYCASRVNNTKGIMLIDSGVETKNIEKAEEAIMEQLRLLKNGCITDEELQNAKLAVKNSLISSQDSLGALQLHYITGVLTGQTLSPQEAAALVDGITKDQITELARQIKPDTVFSLIGN